MDLQKKKRSENWSNKEKDILRELVSQSRHIIEDKSTKASSNNKKTQEWKNIAKKIHQLVGKKRSDVEVKLAWKRMKLVAKANLSAHLKQCQMKTEGGEKPKSPCQEDLAIMNIAPHDFMEQSTDYGNNSIKTEVEVNPLEDTETAGPCFSPMINHIKPCLAVEPPPVFNEVEEIMNQDTSKVNVGTSTPRKNIIRGKPSGKRGPQNTKKIIQEAILKSNTEFKKKQLEILEVEHQYNVKIAELNIKKLELEIKLLQKKNEL